MSTPPKKNEPTNPDDLFHRKPLADFVAEFAWMKDNFVHRDEVEKIAGVLCELLTRIEPGPPNTGCRGLWFIPSAILENARVVLEEAKKKGFVIKE